MQAPISKNEPLQRCVGGVSFKHLHYTFFVVFCTHKYFFSNVEYVCTGTRLVV